MLRALVPVVLLAASSCGVPLIGRKTPAPPVALTNPRNPAQRDAALAYAASLIWAEDTGMMHVYHGQYDANLIDTLGTFGTVAPEIGMHRAKSGDLHSGQMQLRVRIQPRPGYLAGYPPGKYGRIAPGAPYLFPSGISYVWVDSLHLYGQAKGDTAGTAKIVVIPADTTLAVDTASVLVFTRDVLNQAVARFSPAVCWDCMVHQWCALH
jgi:hypothetical protein